MKVQCGLVVIFAIVTAGHASPIQASASEPSHDQTDKTDTVSALTKDQPSSTGLGEEPQPSESRQVVPSLDKTDKTTSSSSERTDSEEDRLVSSLPSWAEGDVYDGNSVDVSDNVDDEKYDEDELLAEIEARLVAGKLETLYQSISHLKSLLYNIKEKAIGDLGNRDRSSYVSVELEDSYASSAEESNNEKTPNRRPDDSSSRVNNSNTNDIPLNRAVESAMAEAQMKDADANVITGGRRFKRDLGWDLGRLNRGRFIQNDADTSFADYEESASSDSALDAFPFAVEANIPEGYDQELQWNSREGEGGRHAFDDWDRILNAYLNRLQRRRRNKEDLRTFLQNMPTLEGMRKRKRSNHEVEPAENEPLIPDPGPLFPAPPNLPPPGNIIHPFLPPDETLAWQPSPDFEEDNALLEEETNALDLTNPGMINRLEYLKSLERSALMEPLEDLAIELAGGHPMLPHVLRVRRVMQIPPPPPYGRKVVKSLYRKKAYGFPFMESAYDELSDPDAEAEAERQWEDHLPFGRTRSSDPRGDQETELIDRLLTVIAKKEAKDRLLARLLSLRDVPPKLQRKILLEALEEEADIGADESVLEENSIGFDMQDSESNASLQWGSYDSDADIDNDIGPEDSLDIAAEGGSSDKGDSVSHGESNDTGYLSGGSQSEALVPAWGSAKEDSHSNVGGFPAY